MSISRRVTTELPKEALEDFFRTIPPSGGLYLEEVDGVPRLTADLSGGRVSRSLGPYRDSPRVESPSIISKIQGLIVLQNNLLPKGAPGSEALVELWIQVLIKLLESVGFEKVILTGNTAACVWKNNVIGITHHFDCTRVKIVPFYSETEEVLLFENYVEPLEIILAVMVIVPHWLVNLEPGLGLVWVDTEDKPKNDSMDPEVFLPANGST